MRRTGWRRLILGSLVLLLALWLLLQLSVGPLVREIAKAVTEHQASNRINQAIETQLELGTIQYETLITLEKDTHGNVTALKTNMAEVNRLKTQILSLIDRELLDLNVQEIGVPLGSLVFPRLFSGTGPKLPVKILTASATDASFRHVFLEAGINQTSHQIHMDVQAAMTILTPGGKERVEASGSVLVAETIIVGQVPQSYVMIE